MHGRRVQRNELCGSGDKEDRERDVTAVRSSVRQPIADGAASPASAIRCLAMARAVRPRIDRTEREGAPGNAATSGATRVPSSDARRGPRGALGIKAALLLGSV
jgi:hypothetical protein